MGKYIGGVPITGFVSPTDTSDTYATHDSQLGRGGFREVSTLVDRDAISSDRRRIGMVTYVIEAQKYYALIGDVTNLSWVDLGSQLGGYDELSTSIAELQDDLVSIDADLDHLSSRLDKVESRVPTYEVSLSLTSSFESDELVYVGLIPYDLEPDLDNSAAHALTRASAIFKIMCDSMEIGAITFNDGDSTGIVTISNSPTINKNSILTITAPTTVTDLADVSVHLSFLIRETI